MHGSSSECCFGPSAVPFAGRALRLSKLTIHDLCTETDANDDADHGYCNTGTIVGTFTTQEPFVMARSRTVRLTALTFANILLPVAVLVFAVGFFPFKPLLPGLATFEDVQEKEVWGEGQPEAIFDRVLFMVVDALRSDFVYGYNSGFDFTQRYGLKKDVGI